MRTEMNNVFVYIEMEGGKVADVSLELLTKGRELASTLGVKVVEKTLVNLYSGETVRCGDTANSRFKK